MRAAHNHDPLRNFAFRISFVDEIQDHGGGTSSGPSAGGNTTQSGEIAGVQRVSGLSVSIGATETWSGGNHRHSYANPDKATWEPITLEQGLALDDRLEKWAEAALYWVTHGSVVKGNPVKRSLYIDVYDPWLHHGQGSKPPIDGLSDSIAERRLAGGQARSRRYEVKNAWVSRYQAMPAFDALGSEVALLSVELTHEGWVRVTENLPAELQRDGENRKTG